MAQGPDIARRDLERSGELLGRPPLRERQVHDAAAPRVELAEAMMQSTDVEALDHGRGEHAVDHGDVEGLSWTFVPDEALVTVMMASMRDVRPGRRSLQAAVDFQLSVVASSRPWATALGWQTTPDRALARATHLHS